MKILAIVVTFNPDIKVIDTLINTLLHQDIETLLVDNASANPPTFHEANRLHFIQHSENLGLAAAYNRGIRFAKSLGATHVVLFDQDSCPDVDMIQILVDTLLQESLSGSSPIAALGPNYEDIKGSHGSPFVRLSGVSLERVACEKECVEVDHLISSGCLIPLDVFDQVGEFREELFIDYVDTEWCWRARRKGYRLLGVGAAKMQHDLGEAHFKVLGKQAILHSPYRIYYQLRNQWWMIRQPWVGWRWRIMDIIRSCKIIVALSVFAPNRRKNIYFIFKGIVDALRGKMGKLDVS